MRQLRIKTQKPSQITDNFLRFDFDETLFFISSQGSQVKLQVTLPNNRYFSIGFG